MSAMAFPEALSLIVVPSTINLSLDKEKEVSKPPPCFVVPVTDIPSFFSNAPSSFCAAFIAASPSAPIALKAIVTVAPELFPAAASIVTVPAADVVSAL